MMSRRLHKHARIAAACATGGLRDFLLARQAIGRHQAFQRSFELMTLASRVRRLRPRSVVEIGTHQGGTLFCWPKVAVPEAILISVDFPDGPGGLGPPDGTSVEAFQSFLSSARQQLVCLRADSGAPETLRAVGAHLQGRPIDFLFIDGDHRYAAVRADYERYGALVRPGGLIALHDIVRDRDRPDLEVHRLWTELERTASTEAILDVESVDGAGMGIGLVRV